MPNPTLTGRSPSEQAVRVALQAVANFPESSDFVEAVQQRLPGLAAYLEVAAQPSGCEPPATPADTLHMEAETTAGTSGNATTGPSDEAGRKRVTQEICASTSAGTVTESPTSHPPQTSNDLNTTINAEECGDPKVTVLNRTLRCSSTANVNARSD